MNRRDHSGLSGAIARHAASVALERIGLQRANRRATTGAALRQLRRVGIEAATVIDAGAAYGRWSLACGGVYPEARYVMIEPLNEFVPFLEAAAAKLDQAVVVQVAVGDAPGRHLLNVHADLVGSSLRQEEDRAVRTKPREVEVTVIDAVVDEHALESPFLLKIDVQGAELDVLRGATTTLGRATAVIVETSTLPFFSGGSEFARLVEFLAARGFALYDVVDLAYRPLDGALAQVDAIFVEETGPARIDHAYADSEARAVQDRRFQLAYRVRRRRLRWKSL